MTLPTDPAKLRDAVELYLAGQNSKQAAAAVGIGASPLAREVRRLGLSRTRRIEVPGAVASYMAGDSVLAIAERHGVTRTVVDRHLTEAGVQRRTPSEQNRLAAAKQSAAERKARAAAAHTAKRGRPPREESVRRSALTRQERGRPESDGERALLGWLQERGQHVGVQTAIGRYNIDLTVTDIAVELLGGEWHGYGRHRARHPARTKAVLDAGWHIIFVWDTPMYPVGPAAADYVVAFAEQTGCDPAAPREYWVIRGDGQLVTGGRADEYDLARIPPARHGAHAAARR